MPNISVYTSTLLSGNVLLFYIPVWLIYKYWLLVSVFVHCHWGRLKCRLKHYSEGCQSNLKRKYFSPCRPLPAAPVSMSSSSSDMIIVTSATSNTVELSMVVASSTTVLSGTFGTFLSYSSPSILRSHFTTDLHYYDITWCCSERMRFRGVNEVYIYSSVSSFVYDGFLLEILQYFSSTLVDMCTPALSDPAFVHSSPDTSLHSEVSCFCFVEYIHAHHSKKYLELKWYTYLHV